MMKFSHDKLNRLRREQGLTYEDLADAVRHLGVPGSRFSTVWRHCAGKTTPRADTVGAYAQAFGVEVQDLYE